MNRKHETLLRRMLRHPEPPAGLSDQLKANLRLQVRAERPAAYRRRAAAAAVLVIAGVLGVFWPGPQDGMPTLVAAAREHAAEESALREIDTADLGAWLRTVGAAAPPGDQLVLFKTCVVDGLEVKHLRLRLESGGTVDLMVDSSGQWAKLPSTDADRGWHVAHPQRNVSLIIFHAPHHASEATRLLQALFPEAGASASFKTEV